MLRENDVLFSTSHPPQLSQNQDTSTTNASAYYSTSSSPSNSFYNSSVNTNFTSLPNQLIQQNDNINTGLPNMSTFYSKDTTFISMSGKYFKLFFIKGSAFSIINNLIHLKLIQFN